VTAIYAIDPLRDPRWAEMVERHPRASVFHTPGWLEALRRTYGYEPVVYTTSPPRADLTDGVVLCRVRSRITGRRLVSLPFSDHCEPLTDSPEDLRTLLNFLESTRSTERWKYVEVRPRTPRAVPGMSLAQKYCLHSLDLGPELDKLFHQLHKNSTQRKIRRAERERLTYDEGRSEALVDTFYALLLRTRRRHHLPPQPRAWFIQLAECLGNSMKIRVASKDGRPIASILTFSWKDVMVYKYGCSDERFHNLGGVHLLFWTAIQEARTTGCREFDLGRSECDNLGLITFKDHWGASRSELAYWRHPAPVVPNAAAALAWRLVKFTFSRFPDRLLIATANVFYKHIG
jgi:CelD/BcsL family acetyltransferase involved in cellulose biosynthesis